MKTKYIILLFCITIASIQIGFGQARDTRLKTKGYVNPQEIVSLDSTMRMDQALMVINELSKQFAGKIIIDLEKRRNPIGVYVVNQHWRDALDMILSHNGLTYVEETDFIRIMVPGATVAAPGAGAPTPGEPPPTLDSRDVRISAVFFSTNFKKLQDFGISWDFFRSKSKEPSIESFISANLGKGDTLPLRSPYAVPQRSQNQSLEKAVAAIHSPPEFTFANIDALVKFFGSNELGDVLTSPDLVVRNGKKGRIQVGKDIFVTTRDIAGNTVNQPISTGTIIDVSPTIYTQNDTDFVYLDLTIEQSDASPGTGASPEIARTNVRTHSLLYDGEETVIGGLVSTSSQEVREGIPFLKDLPWWFFGLRYIFGSESKTKFKSELIILLKAELLQPIRDRMIHRQTRDDIINNKRIEYQRDYEKK